MEESLVESRPIDSSSCSVFPWVSEQRRDNDCPQDMRCQTNHVNYSDPSVQQKVGDTYFPELLNIIFSFPWWNKIFHQSNYELLVTHMRSPCFPSTGSAQRSPLECQQLEASVSLWDQGKMLRSRSCHFQNKSQRTVQWSKKWHGCAYWEKQKEATI